MLLMARFKSAINVPKLSGILSIRLTSRLSYPQSNEIWNLELLSGMADRASGKVD
jgi:hypothetical protein